MPKEKPASDNISLNTILPEGIEFVPPRFAIPRDENCHFEMICAYLFDMSAQVFTPAACSGCLQFISKADKYDSGNKLQTVG